MLVVFEAFYLLNARSFYGSVLSRKGLFDNPYVPLTISLVLTIQGLFTYTDVMQTLFHTTELSVAAWGRIAAIGLVIFSMVELEKYVWRIGLKRRNLNLKN